MEFHVNVGEHVRFSKTVGETDVYLFAGLSGDLGPNHVNEEYMKGTAFGGRIAHGALLVAYMSAASTLMCARSADDGRETPVNLGYDMIRFLKPVRLGDTITVEYAVTEVDPVRRRAACNVRVLNQHGEITAVATNILMWIPRPAASARTDQSAGLEVG